MVESTCFQHTSSHPVKYNNSVDRIISKEEKREDIQGEILQSSSSTVVFPHSYKNYSVSTRNPALLQVFQSSRARINSSTRNTTTTRLIPCHPVQIITRHPPMTVPHASKHSTWQNKAPGYPTAFQGHTALAGFQLILPGRNSILSGSQIHAAPTAVPRPVLHYRILPEIGFISKGSSIVYLCNTKVSVFQFTYSCFRIILQEY